MENSSATLTEFMIYCKIASFYLTKPHGGKPWFVVIMTIKKEQCENLVTLNMPFLITQTITFYIHLRTANQIFHNTVKLG